MKLRNVIAVTLLTQLLIVSVSLAKTFFTREPALKIFIPKPYFSPNDDNNSDTVTVQIRGRMRRAKKWDIVVRDINDIAVRRYEGTEHFPDTWVWNGTNQNGAPAAEGIYFATLNAYPKEDQMLASDPQQIVLDRTPPVVKIASKKNFNWADGKISDIKLQLSVMDLVGIHSWHVEILDTQEVVLDRHEALGPAPAELTMPAIKIDQAPEKIFVRITAQDLAGNTIISDPLTIDPNNAPHAMAAKVETESPASTISAIPSNAAAASKNGLRLTMHFTIDSIFQSKMGPDGMPVFNGNAALLLTPVAQALEASPNGRAEILGYVASQDTNDRAKGLSSIYAWKVFGYLVRDLGVTKDMLTANGMGAVPNSPGAANSAGHIVIELSIRP